MPQEILGIEYLWEQAAGGCGRGGRTSGSAWGEVIELACHVASLSREPQHDESDDDGHVQPQQDLDLKLPHTSEALFPVVLCPSHRRRPDTLN